MRWLCLVVAASLIGGSWAQYRPWRCPQGHGYNRRVRSCQPCPIGTYQPSSFTTCFWCPFGRTTVNVGAISRSDCVRRSLVSTQTTASRIPQPNIPTTTNRPRYCIPGCFYNTTSGRCQFCPVGKYQPFISRSPCLSCPSGTTTQNIGSFRRWQCIVSDERSTSTPSRDPTPQTTAPQPTAIDCGPGCFFNDTSQQCQKCPIGEYQPFFEKRSCFACPRGTTTRETGAIFQFECRISESDEDEESNSERSDESGDTTDSSTTTKAPSSEKAPTSAPWKSSTTASNEPPPINCVPGCFFDETSRRCVLCPKGTYQPNSGALSCISCTRPTTTLDVGATSIYQCIEEFPAIATTVVFSTAPIQPSSTTSPPLNKCEPGNFLDETTQQCLPCPIGTYQPNPRTLSCLPCPGGTTTFAVGISSVYECIDPEDVFTIVTFPVSSTTIPPVQSNCGFGTFFDVTSRQCRSCPVGTYQPNLRAHSCIPCRRGTTTSGVGAFSIYACFDPKETIAPTVQTSSTKKQPSPDDCASGNFFDRTARQCRLCPKGTYQPNPRTLSCLSCPRHTTTFEVGATSIYECIDDQYNPPAEELTTTTTTTSTQSPEDCEPGYFYNDGSRNCQQCEIGYYQSYAAQHFCYSCPGGLTTQGLGATDRDQCFVPVAASSCGELLKKKCQNGGTCVEKNQEVTCMCRPEWGGKDCEEPVARNKKGFSWLYIAGALVGGLAVILIISLCIRDTLKKKRAAQRYADVYRVSSKKYNPSSVHTSLPPRRLRPASTARSSLYTVGKDSYKEKPKCYEGVRTAKRAYPNKHQESLYRVSSNMHDPPPAYPSLPPRRVKPSIRTPSTAGKGVIRPYQANRSRRSSLKLSGLKNKPTKAVPNSYVYS